MSRKLAKQNPEMHRPGVAATLNSLAILYSQTQRLGKAEKAYDESLAIYRDLAKRNPELYRSQVAKALNDLAIVYRNTRRPKEASKALREAKNLQNR
jgi:tetratricopeptide (TPR) repeat protein